MGLWALAHFRAWASNTGDERVNLVKRHMNLAEFGLRDEFIHQDVASGRAMPEASQLSPAAFETRPIESSRF